MIDNVTISPEILHKGSADDVLIRAPRFAVPLYLSAEACTSNVHNPVLRNYVPCANQRSKFVVLQNLLAKGAMEGAFARGVEADDDWSNARALPWQIVTPHFAEEMDAGSEVQKQALAALCESIPAIRRSSSFQLINDADNYFFYRKEHEHVPGTMFIEAARQAVYHHLYHHTSHARGAVTVSLNELNASYLSYAELMYPIELVVDNISPADSSSPKKVHVRVAFYQRQKLFATVDTKATIIDVRLFEKTRNIFIYSDDWYAPIKPSKLVCTISDKKGRKSDVTLMGLGQRGCVTTHSDVDLTEPVSLQISYQGKFDFVSNVQCVQQGKYSTWDFLNVDFNGLQNISDMIKRGFVHLNDAALSALKE